MQRLKIKMKLNKAKRLSKKYEWFTITENGYTTAIVFNEINKTIEF